MRYLEPKFCVHVVQNAQRTWLAAVIKQYQKQSTEENVDPPNVNPKPFYSEYHLDDAHETSKKCAHNLLQCYCKLVAQQHRSIISLKQFIEILCAFELYYDKMCL